MRFNVVVYLLSSTFFTLALSQSTQDPGPSPTASVGCEPHEDHWHCDGPRSGVATPTATAAAAAQEDENVQQGETPASPPPTESVGCVAHGDHYHCSGPATSAATATAAAATQNDNLGSGTPASPPPTESVGCVAHGDHYHCSGPATAGVSATATATATGAAAAEDEHESESEGATPTYPAPTESVGCAAHGDHYHCSGRASAVQATSSPTTSRSTGTPNGNSSSPVVPFQGAGTSSQALSAVMMTGLVGVVALLLVI
ncbi:MAG: hypothetical protein Q9223_005616 [Gallowayella weberi]